MKLNPFSPVGVLGCPGIGWKPISPRPSHCSSPPHHLASLLPFPASLPPSASAPLPPRGPHIRTPHNLGASQVPPVHAQKWRHLWVLLGLGGERRAGGCGRYRALRERRWGHGAGWERTTIGHSTSDFNMGWTARGRGLGWWVHAAMPRDACVCGVQKGPVCDHVHLQCTESWNS